MSDSVKVQIRFTENVIVNGHIIPFSDALYFSQEEYLSLDASAIAAKKQERINNWKNMLENPPPYVPPTPEQLQQELQNIKDGEENVTARKKEILVALGSTELEAEQAEMQDIEAKFNKVKDKVDSLSADVVPLEAVAEILENQKKDVDERIAKKQ